MECRLGRTECAARFVGRRDLAFLSRPARNARIPMPFFLIPSALGVSFFLIWAFIGGMIIRDSQIAAQRDVDSDITVLPRAISRGPHTSARPKTKRPRRNAV